MGKYDCTKCENKFTRNESLQKHLVNWHNLNPPIECEYYICDENDKYTIKCNEQFTELNIYKPHIEQHTNKKDHKFKCNVCSFTSLFSQTIRKHEKTIHEDKRDYKCEYCEFEFKTSSNLQQHITSCLKIKNYKCNFCENTFTRIAHCRDHEKNIHGKESIE
jgi:uncharacterized Zn-finger protein